MRGVIFLLLSDKTFLSRAYKIRAGIYWRSQPFWVTLLLPQTKTTMGKSNHFSGQPIVEPYHYASVNFCRTAIIPNRKRGRVKVKWHARVIIDVLWESVFVESYGLFANINLAYVISFFDNVNSGGGGLHYAYALEVEVFSINTRVICRDIVNTR